MSDLGDRRRADGWRDLMRRNARNWLLQDCVEEGLPERLLMLLGNSDLFDEQSMESALGPVQRRGVFRAGSADGTPVAYTTPLFGSPKTAMYLEVAASAGVRSVIGLGYCGGITAEAAVGALFVPASALALDGTTRAYGLGGEAGPDPGLTDSLLNACRERGVPASSGRIASIDAIMLESDEMLADLRGRGAAAVDLETGCLFALAGRLGVSVAAMHIVSDNAAAGDIDERGRHMLGADSQIGVALGVLASV